MFDNQILFPRYGNQVSNQKCTVTEYKAPTDDSVRLLKEFEEKARDNLISVTKLENNLFKATWHTFDNHLNMSKDVYCRFELNGKEYELKLVVSKPLSNEQLVEYVYKAIVEKLSEVLTKDLFMSNLQYATF